MKTAKKKKRGKKGPTCDQETALGRKCKNLIGFGQDACWYHKGPEDPGLGKPKRGTPVVKVRESGRVTKDGVRQIERLVEARVTEVIDARTAEIKAELKAGKGPARSPQYPPKMKSVSGFEEIGDRKDLMKAWNHLLREVDKNAMDSKQSQVLVGVLRGINGTMDAMESGPSGREEKFLDEFVSGLKTRPRPSLTKDDIPKLEEDMRARLKVIKGGKAADAELPKDSTLMEDLAEMEREEQEREGGKAG